MDFNQLKQQYDSSDMLSRIDEFPDRFARAFEMGFRADLPPQFKGAERVMGLGMGGSGMGYTILKALARNFGSVPVEVISNYRLPPYANERTAVSITSYSGHTEETLEAAEQAREKHCPMVCITTGDKLAAWAIEHDLELIQFEYTVVPRVGLPYTFGIAFGVFCQAGFLRPGSPAPEVVSASLNGLQRYADFAGMRQEAQELAIKLQGKIIYCVGSGFSAAVAVRWKGQMNENAKTIAFAEEMPEMCHNMFLGYQHPESIRSNSAVIFLHSSYDHPRNIKRAEIVGRTLADTGAYVIHPTVHPSLSLIGTLIAQIMFGDYVSYYLALLNGVDPVDTQRIAELKEKLAGSVDRPKLD